MQVHLVTAFGCTSSPNAAEPQDSAPAAVCGQPAAVVGRTWRAPGPPPRLVVETYTPLRDLRPCTWLPGCDLPVSVDAGCQHLYVDPYLLASSQTKMSGPDLAAPIERRFCTDSSVQYEDAGTCVPIRSFQLQTVVAVRGSQHCCAVAAVTHLSAAQRRSHACASAVACCVTHVTTLASRIGVTYCIYIGAI
jgi:hypothetical protein